MRGVVVFVAQRSKPHLAHTRIVFAHLIEAKVDHQTHGEGVTHKQLTVAA